MSVNVTTYVKSLNTKTLVDIFNLVNPTSQIKKFADRATAEKRMLKVIGGSPDYVTFYRENAAKLKAAAIELPAIEEPKPAVKPAVAKKPKADAADAPAGEKKQKKVPHLNLRCPHCGYYAKSTPAMLKIARLACPVDKAHGALLTAEERGENRGR